MVAFKTTYGVIQQSLYYSTVYSSPEVDCPSTNLQRANELSPYYVFWVCPFGLRVQVAA